MPAGFSRSRSPASTPRSSTSSATATSTAACCLVAPQLQSTSSRPSATARSSTRNHHAHWWTAVSPLYFVPSGLGGYQTSWQGVNDLSARPASTGAPFNNNSVILNTLGDLTNRENRGFYQRFSSDFQDINGNLVVGGDGLDDDLNGDNVPDYYPRSTPRFWRP